MCLGSRCHLGLNLQFVHKIAQNACTAYINNGYYAVSALSGHVTWGQI